MDDPRLFRPSTQASTRPYSAFAEPFSEGRGTTGSKAGSEVPLDLEESADLAALGGGGGGGASTGSTLPADIVMVEAIESPRHHRTGSGSGSGSGSRRTGTNPGSMPRRLVPSRSTRGSRDSDGTGDSFVVGLAAQGLAPPQHGRRRLVSPRRGAGAGAGAGGGGSGTRSPSPLTGGRRRDSAKSHGRDSAKSHGRGSGAGSGVRPPSGARARGGARSGEGSGGGREQGGGHTAAHTMTEDHHGAGGGITAAAQARRSHRTSITSHAGGWDSVKTLPPPDMPSWANDSSDSFAALAVEGAAVEAEAAAKAGGADGHRPASRGRHRQSRSLGQAQQRAPSPQPSSVSTASTYGEPEGGGGDASGAEEGEQKAEVPVTPAATTAARAARFARVLPSPSPSPTLPLRAPVRTQSPVLTMAGGSDDGVGGSRRRLVLRGNLRGAALDESLDEEGNPHSSRVGAAAASRGAISGRRSAACVRGDGGLVARFGADLFASEIL